jgi:septal ring factor EnvC (AmiA/AmiB activator)
VLLFVVAIAMAAPILAQDSSQEEIDKKKNELEQLRKELEAKRKKAKELEGQEKGVQAQIEELDGSLALTEEYIRKLEEREKQVQKELAELEVHLTDASGNLEQRKTLMGRRLRAMYKYGRYRSLAAIVSSSSFADVMSHVRFLGLVAKRDKKIMESIQNYQAEVISTQTELENSKAEIDRIQSEKESEKKNLASTKKKREVAIASIRGQKEAELAAAKELEQTAIAIQKLIETLEAARRQSDVVPQWASDLPGAKGTVPWPVNGEVVTRFGKSVNPRFGTTTYSNGIDIKAPVGTPIRCVADGKVEFIDNLPGYDRCIIVNHGRGYYTLYAHAVSVTVSVGQEIKGGDAIASIGEGSSVKGTVLHFEIRKGKEAQNPLSWLLKK